MNRILHLLITCLLIAEVHGQSANRPLRLEFDARPNAEPFQVVPLGADGLLVLLKTNEFEERNTRKWGFAYYDTSMELQWEFVVFLYRNQEYGAWATENGEVSLLFYDSRAAAEINVQVLTVNPVAKQHRLSEGSADKRFVPANFVRSGDHAFIGMNAKNEYKVYKINVFDGNLMELSTQNTGGVYLENLQKDSLSGDIIVLTGLRNDRRRNALYMHRFDNNGQEKAFHPLIKNENKKMATSAQFVSLGHDAFMVLGTFTAFPSRRSSMVTDADGSRSSGFYKAIVKPELTAPVVQFYNFSDLNNLDSYLRGSVAEQRQRSQRGLFGRSRSSNIEHFLIIHKVVESNGSWLIAGEAFTPDFRTVTTVAYDYYGRPVPRTYSVFDGYRYSHALVAAFDQEGRLIWDNGMEMINIRTFDLYPKLVVHQVDDTQVLAYNHDGKIAWKTINENKTITNTSYANVETRFSKDRVNTEQTSRLQHWYGDYFLATGYQTITNNYLPEQNRRSVFYINKIAFD